MTGTIYLPGVDEDNPCFPPVEQALDEPDGLLAVGGRLDAKTLRLAYRKGIFPWYSEPQPVLWWCPSERAILRPGTEHTSRSMAKIIRQGQFRITSNQCFDQVVRHCSAPRAKADGTWITPAIRLAYGDLHRQGVAHSVECWHSDRLVGGLYGVQVGSAFCGESMFSLESNASKLAFISLSRTLHAHHFQLIDCQLENPHLNSLGIEMVSRQFFLEMLAKAAADDIHWPESEAFQKCMTPSHD